MQTAGRNVAGSWGSLMMLNHLYNASLKTKFNNTLWPDLDCLISIHYENFLFFGGAPKCPHDFTVKCAMALGVYNISQSIPNLRKNYTNTSENKIRHFTAVVSAAKTLEHSYCDTQSIEHDEYYGGQKLSVASVKMLQEKARLQKDIVQPIDMPASEQFLLPYKGRLRNNDRDRDSEKLSPIQLLNALCIALNSKYTSLHFDYLSMHMRCTRLYQQLKEDFDAICTRLGNGQAVKPRSDKDIAQLPFFILQQHEMVVNRTGKNLKGKVNGEKAQEGSAELDKIRALREESEKFRTQGCGV